jgi:predicted Zn-dependent protease
LIFQGVRYVQLSNLSDQDEVNLGTQIDQQMKAQGLPIYNNPAIRGYIDEIGQRLAANSERTNIPYTFQVVADNSINAFATTGGFVYIHTGLIAAADNEAELAGVIGHEIGHITGRHVINRMREAAIASGIAGALEVDQDTLVNIGIQLALQLPNSREAEYDADRRGFHILGHTGYDTSGFVSFFEKLNIWAAPRRSSSVPTPTQVIGSTICSKCKLRLIILIMVMVPTPLLTAAALVVCNKLLTTGSEAPKNQVLVDL